MKTHFDYIVDYLSEKEKSLFTGSIKFSFERAKLVSIVESSSFDEFDISQILIENNKQCGDLLKPCFNDNFCGWISFFIKGGEATGYNYLKTLKGENIMKFLEAETCKSVKIAGAR